MNLRKKLFFHFAREMFISCLLMVYTFHSLFFVRLCSNLNEFNNRSQYLTVKLL